MNFLEKLSPEHRQTIIRLPYRVGLWVSQSDSSGGSESNERELQALSNIIHAFAEELFGSENIQYIMSDTLRQKADWPNWGANLDMVPNECATAIDLLRQYGEDKDAKAFKNHLMEIAEAVAQAFREKESISVFSAFGMYVQYLLSGTKAGRKKSFNEFLNISASERKILSAIAEALEAA